MHMMQHSDDPSTRINEKSPLPPIFDNSESNMSAPPQNIAKPVVPPLTPAQAKNTSHALSGLWEGKIGGQSHLAQLLVVRSGTCTTVVKDRPREPQIVVWKAVELFFNLETTRIGTIHGKGDSKGFPCSSDS